MNKYILTSILSIALPIAAAAQYTGPSVQVTAMSVAEVKELKDDANVLLEGTIERHLGKDKYLFNDGADSITVEIDRREWRGLSVSEKTKVRIRGEVDKDWFREPQIDAKSIEIIK